MQCVLIFVCCASVNCLHACVREHKIVSVGVWLYACVGCIIMRWVC